MSITTAQDPPARVSLLEILEACDPQGTLYPESPSLASGLCSIAIGLSAVERELEILVERDGHLPPALEQVASRLFDQGSTAFSTLHERAMVPA